MKISDLSNRIEEKNEEKERERERGGGRGGRREDWDSEERMNSVSPAVFDSTQPNIWHEN